MAPAAARLNGVLGLMIYVCEGLGTSPKLTIAQC